MSTRVIYESSNPFLTSIADSCIKIVPESFKSSDVLWRIHEETKYVRGAANESRRIPEIRESRRGIVGDASAFA
jgi:hypothetical protein